MRLLAPRKGRIWAIQRLTEAAPKGVRSTSQTERRGLISVQRQAFSWGGQLWVGNPLQ